jgi:hypothetical protein
MRAPDGTGNAKACHFDEQLRVVQAGGVRRNIIPPVPYLTNVKDFSFAPTLIPSLALSK